MVLKGLVVLCVHSRRGAPGSAAPARRSITLCGGFAMACALAVGCASAPRPPPGPPPVDTARELRLAADARAAGRLDVAREHLKKAVDADPTLVDARLDLAEILLAQGGALDRAAAVLREAWRIQPGGARLDRLRGSLREQSGDLAGAVDAYGAALALEPEPEVRLRRGLLLARLGRRAEAIAELERVRAERPEALGARSALADLYEATGRISQAEGELATLADMERDAPAYRRLARFLARCGAPTRARAAERRAVELEPRGARSLRPLLPARR
jgi:tetratricopeptide (TPR) repeat protein